jgi:hypothetical protein
MRSFLNNLVRGYWKAKTTRPARRAPSRANVQLEFLEDRLVPTTATLSGSTLAINNIGQNHQITLEANTSHQIEVLDNGVLVNKNDLFNISSINAVNITVPGDDNVLINDSNGMPFAPKTSITLDGTGAGNSMTLTGSLAISGDELLDAGAAANAAGKLFVDDLSFQLDGAIAVNDFVKITGTLDVQTWSTSVELSGSNGSTQTLSGLGFGGGNTLTYANKPTVQLDVNAASAIVTLDASTAAAGENFFQVQMHGANDVTVIQATPSSVFTNVSSVVAPSATPALVVLQRNAGFVDIEGNAETTVSVGQPVGNLSSTQGILANVEVIGAGSLTLSDNASDLAQSVTVEQETVAGTGLFGNNSVLFSYLNVKSLTLETSQGADQYDVDGAASNSPFTSQITIDDFSTSKAGLIATVNLAAKNELNLRLTNEEVGIPAQLFFFPGSGTVSTSNPERGVEIVTASFPGELPSQLVVTDFTSVGE